MKLKLTPVFVTEKEEEGWSLQNKTKDKIKTLIYRLIESLDEKSAELQSKIYEKTVKKMKKEKFMEFFLSTVKQIEDSNNFNDAINIDSSE